MKEFMYLSENEKFNGGYIIIPNAIYTLNFYKGLSNDAILLYGILLNRFKLSSKNSRVDEFDRVYVLASTASIMELLSVSRGKSRNVVAELEKFSLIKIEKERGYNSKRRFYLGAISNEKTLEIGKKISNIQGLNNELSGDKICTQEGSNNKQSGVEICTQEGSNNELSRGQNMYPNKNINKYNIKNSQTKWGSSGSYENSNAFDFSD